MRKIKIKSWKEPQKNGELMDVTIINGFINLVGTADPRSIPSGLDAFRTFGKINKAFESAKKTNVLVLEEAEYKFLRDFVDKNVPSTWGLNLNINEALEAFMGAEFIEPK